MTNIEEIFAEYFAHWGIKLPPDAIAMKQPGTIHKAGWTIRYVFYEDCLDYYATHRMTNERHVRIHADGHSESLDSRREFVVYPKDADEEARLKAKEDYQAHNQAVYAKLREKGLIE